MSIRTISDEAEVSWQVDDIEVNASLSLPEGEGPFPAVIMVAGSGPTDRNWNSPMIPGTNGSGALLARILTDLGYVTLRYDKRASGPHGKENAIKLLGKVSLQGHLDELAGGVQMLTKRKEVDSSHIFALTNSEGCIHALNYQIQAQSQPFAGLVLTSAPARAVGTVARGQIAAQLKGVPDGDQWLAAYDAAMADFTVGRSVKMDESLPEGLRAMILSVTNPINLPFARELWVADPAMLLTKVSIPSLIVIGKKDIQVDWQEDGVVFERMAKSHRNITFITAENANHVLKNELRDRSQLTAAEAMTAYNSDESRLDLECVDIITTWLRTHQ